MSRSILCVLTLFLTLTATVAQDLTDRVRDASSVERTWVSWTVPSTASGGICCGSSRHSRWTTQPCSLEDDDISSHREEGEDGEAGHSEPTNRGTARIWVRAAGGTIDRIKLVSIDCDVESSGLRTALLADVDPAQSVALLAGLFNARHRRLRENAIFAVAVHADPAADDVLVRQLASGSGEMRARAAFWLAGERSTRTLEQAIEDDPQSEVRQHAVFAISQLPAERGVPLLIGLAQTHRDREVRRQAIFWLGQTDDPRATDFLVSLLD